MFYLIIHTYVWYIYMNNVNSAKGMGNRKHCCLLLQENRFWWVLSFLRKLSQHNLLYWPLKPELFLYRRVRVFSTFSWLRFVVLKPMFSLFGNIFLTKTCFSVPITFTFCKYHVVNTSQPPKFDDRSLFICGILIWFAAILNCLKIWRIKKERKIGLEIGSFFNTHTHTHTCTYIYICTHIYHHHYHHQQVVPIARNSLTFYLHPSFPIVYLPWPVL